MKSRIKLSFLEKALKSKVSRVVVLTGARQVGKSTLLKTALPDYRYISFDDPIKRAAYARWTCDDFHANGTHWIIDEAQKLPGIFDTVKAAHDAYPAMRFVLTGSSQIMLLSRIRESLAGRATVLELFSLTLPELDTENFGEPVCESCFAQLLRKTVDSATLLRRQPVLQSGYAAQKRSFELLCERGTMPALYGHNLGEADARDWLEQYVSAYLQRDIRDLARMNDLDSFVKAERALATRCAQTVNFSDLARLSGISPATAKKFVTYLEISYQVFMLEAYSRNPEKRLSKMTKCIFADQGVLRAVSGQWDRAQGSVFENGVIAEMVRQIRSFGIAAKVYHLRTVDGREVDALFETEQGFFAVEVKSADTVSKADARHVRDLADYLDKPLLASLVVSRDDESRELCPGVYAFPAAGLLGVGS